MSCREGFEDSPDLCLEEVSRQKVARCSSVNTIIGLVKEPIFDRIKEMLEALKQL